MAWRFRSPHHSWGEPDMWTSEPKPHWTRDTAKEVEFTFGTIGAVAAVPRQSLTIF
jgi:hypothetical protein